MSRINDRLRRAQEKLTAWLDRGGRRAFNKPRRKSAAPVAAVDAGLGVPPLPLVGRLVFSLRDERDGFELLPRPMGCRVQVPGGAMFTNGNRSSRCEAEGTPP